MTLWTVTYQVLLSSTMFWSLLKFMSIKSVMLSNRFILWHALLLPSIFPSIKVFCNELALRIRWSKYWSFSVSPSHEYSGLIFFRIDWFDLLAVQGTLKSLLQHHRSEVSILQCSAFFLVTSIRDYWKNRGFDYIDLCWQSDVSAFQYAVQVCHTTNFLSKDAF